MKLIPNWKDIAFRAHSMWAFYLSVVALTLPEGIYFILGRDTNPRFWWLTGLVLLLYGIWGRLIDQGGAKPTGWRSTLVKVIRAIVLIGAMVVVVSLTAGMTSWKQAGKPIPGPEVVVTTRPAPTPGGAGYDAQFLDVAVPLIGKWEGLRLTAYKDIVGVWTVCYGETKGVRPGDTYTKAQCDAMLAREIISYRDRLNAYFTADTKAKRLPVTRDVAFTSLSYNVGVAGTGKSTAVRRLNAGDVPGACTALTWWNKAGGRVIRGLVNRRTEEHKLCLMGVA